MAAMFIKPPPTQLDMSVSPSAKAVDERHEAWKGDIPLGDDETLWTWLDGLDEASRQALLAHCVSYGINALYERPNPYSGSGAVGLRALRRTLRIQLAPQDVVRFMRRGTARTG